MNKISIALIGLLATSVAVNAQSKKNEYVPLFNGSNGQGWHSANGTTFPEKGWQINKDTISIQASGGKEATAFGDIVTDKEYSAFDLIFDFKLTPGANSGVKYFVTLAEKSTGSAIGLEYQVLDDERHPDAKLGKDGNRTLASLYDLIKGEKPQSAIKPIGEWNHGRIIVYPNNPVEHYLNGVKVLEYERGSAAFKALVAQSKYAKWPNFGEAKKGHILLQDHGNDVSFRNIRIKELN
jgi:hypothetical protein